MLNAAVTKPPWPSRIGLTTKLSCPAVLFRNPCSYTTLSEFQNRRATATLTSTASGNPFRTLPKGNRFLSLILSPADASAEPPPREVRPYNTPGASTGGMSRGGGGGGNFRGGAPSAGMANNMMGMGMPMNPTNMMRGMAMAGMMGNLGMGMGMPMGIGMPMGVGMGAQAGFVGGGRG